MKIIVLISVLLFSLFSCDKPNEPKPEPEKDTKVYFFEQSGSQKLYIYSTLHNRLDSTVLPYTDVDFIEVSPDGAKLYLVGSSITILETKSFNKIGEINIDNIRKCSISPDNQYIALVGVGFYLLETSTHTVLYADTTRRSSSPYFSKNSQSLYCIASDSIYAETRFVQKLDLTTTPFTKTIKRFPFQYPISIKVSSDEQKWYLTSSIAPYTVGFEVYDVALDSLIYIYAMCQAGIKTIISPDDDFVYFTNPGNFDCVLLPNLKIYDVSTNSVDDFLSETIDSQYISDDTSELEFIDDVVIDEKNKKIVILSGRIIVNAFHVVDYEQGELILRNRYYNDHYYFSNLTLNED